MHRWLAAAVTLGGLVGAAGRWPLRAAAGASGVSVRVSPNHGLVDGQTVTLTGAGPGSLGRRETR